MIDNTHQYDLQIHVNGKPVIEYPHADGYTYIEGRVGSYYTLKLINRSFERVLMVPSVDGLSVLNGKADWEDGYVVDAYSEIEIPGWRRDASVAAGFQFSDAKTSYTNRMGNGTSNVGVIGLMVFREQKHTTTLNAVRNMQISASGANWSKNIDNTSFASEVGTGWGNDVSFNTTSVNFEKRDPNHPDAVIALYYDTAKGLEKRGIKIRSTGYPNPFPGYNGSGSCPPPPTYR